MDFFLLHGQITIKVPARPRPKPHKTHTKSHTKTHTKTHTKHRKMSQGSVLQALQTILDTKLRYFALVSSALRCTPSMSRKEMWTELSKLYYICLGNHEMIILDRNFVADEAKGGFRATIMYSEISALKHDGNELLEIITATAGKQRCILRAVELDSLIKEFCISWKSDYMYQHLAVADIPIERCDVELPFSSGSLPPEWTVTNDDTFVRAPQGTRKHEHAGYCFFAPKSFTVDKARSSSISSQICLIESTGSTSPTSAKSNASKLPRCECLMLKVSPSVRVEDTYGVSCETLCMKALMEIASEFPSFRYIAHARDYNKKMNLTGDAAEWEGSIVRVRAATSTSTEREIIVLAYRRKYIPPVMDTAQNMILAYYGKEGRVDYANACAIPELVCDTTMPVSRSHQIDKVVIQAKADALIVSEETFTWFQRRLDICPRNLSACKEICFSVLKILMSTGVMEKARLPNIIKRNTGDPFEVARKLEKQRAGMETIDKAAIRHWKRRVWRYISYCVDGGFLPQHMTIAILVDCHTALVSMPREQNRIAHFLETLLYMHPVGRDFTYTPLGLSVRDSVLMSNFTFNDRVMIRLLETNYVKNVIGAKRTPGGVRDESEYPRFLIRLLQRQPQKMETCSKALRYTVCKQIVTMSMRGIQLDRDGDHDEEFDGGEGGGAGYTDTSGAMDRGGRGNTALDEVTLNMLIPVVTSLLRDHDENVQILAAAALVNYTHRHPAMKNAVMASGAVRRVVGLLLSPNDDLVRHCCALLNNCSKTPQYRQAVVSFGAVPRLVDLTRAFKSTPRHRSKPMLVQCMAVLGNLAHDARIRERISTASGGCIITNVSGVLALLEEEEEEAAHDADDEQLNILLFHCVNLLKNLAVRNDRNKVAMRSALPHLQRIALERGNFRPLIAVVLETMYVLCFNDENRKALFFRYALSDILHTYSTVPGLSKIVDDLRRLKGQLD